MTNDNNKEYERDDHEKKRTGMRKWDNAVTIIFVLALIVISFFWKCHYDPIVTIIAAVITASATLIGHSQYKKIRKLSAETNTENGEWR